MKENRLWLFLIKLSKILLIYIIIEINSSKPEFQANHSTQTFKKVKISLINYKKPDQWGAAHMGIIKLFI